MQIDFVGGPWDGAKITALRRTVKKHCATAIDGHYRIRGWLGHDSHIIYDSGHAVMGEEHLIMHFVGWE
jgi:hypothetical protein